MGDDERIAIPERSTPAAGPSAWSSSVLLVGTAWSRCGSFPWVLVWAWLGPLPATPAGTGRPGRGPWGFSGVVVRVTSATVRRPSPRRGWHDRERGVPARADAYFKIASISKLYTAVVITKLVAEGRLSLNGTLAEYLPELAGRIEHAGGHHAEGCWCSTAADPQLHRIRRTTGRIPGENGAGGPGAGPGPARRFRTGPTPCVLQHELPPAGQGSSNAPRATGRFQAIQERILTPLQLRHTFASVKDVDIGDVMSGHHEGHDADLKTDDIGMVATAADVCAFLRALNTGTLADPAKSGRSTRPSTNTNTQAGCPATRASRSTTPTWTP